MGAKLPPKSMVHSRLDSAGASRPRDVVLYSKEGERLGSEQSFKQLLQEITRIPVAALDSQPLPRFPTAERMLWAQGRLTKKIEDRAYCLLGIFNVFMYLNYGEGDIAFLRLTEEVNKGSSKATQIIGVAPGAMFDSHGQTHQECHPPTHPDLLQSIRSWTRDDNGNCIFWLNGAAGTGKSIVSCTVAKRLANFGPGSLVTLGATFFFRRGECDQPTAERLFPTIASQLATNMPGFEMTFAQVLQDDPFISSKSLAARFNKLVMTPLQRLVSGTDDRTYVIVIDALDECSSEDDIRTVLQSWSKSSGINRSRLHLFLTSRPELPIRFGFKKMSADVHHGVTLHEIPKQTVQHDIFAYLSDALAEMGQDYNLTLDGDLEDERLAVDWLGATIVNTLNDMAMPLFIVAATMHRLIRETDHPQQLLSSILSSRNTTTVPNMGQIYMCVLQAQTRLIRDKHDLSRTHSMFRTVVGTIVSLGEPVSRTTLSALLDVSAIDVQNCLRSFHAVLDIPRDRSAIIRPFHLSFGEYLRSREVYGTPYWIDTTAMHISPWKRCLQILSHSTGLQENICRLSYPGQLRSDVPLLQVEQHMSHALQYACRYWIDHVHTSTYRIRDGDEIHLFLLRHSLHWLEALSFMD